MVPLGQNRSKRCTTRCLQHFTSKLLPQMDSDGGLLYVRTHATDIGYDNVPGPRLNCPRDVRAERHSFGKI